MRRGGKGYVFQSRFKSTIIEDDGYLLKSIGYLLQNPVRAGIVFHAEYYPWSSIQYCISNHQSDIVDGEYVNQLFGTKEYLLDDLKSWSHKEIPVILTKHGEILGSDEFLKLALKKFNRRKPPNEHSPGVRRKGDLVFERRLYKISKDRKKVEGQQARELQQLLIICTHRPLFFFFSAFQSRNTVGLYNEPISGLTTFTCVARPGIS